jgi:hypothetical protein
MTEMGPRLLDLFCKAGGAAAGYARAGYAVTGVDHEPQPRYLRSGAVAFVQADALEYLRSHGREYDAIHASPPCQCYTRACFAARARDRHPDLVGVTRAALEWAARPWVIENVPHAPLRMPAVMLCGLMFGLRVLRHRWFESSEFLFPLPPHPSHRGRLIGRDGLCCVVGHGGGVSRMMRAQIARLRRHGAGGQQTKADWEQAMGIDWMTRNELSQAIPPSYTEWVGRLLLRVAEVTP